MAAQTKTLTALLQHATISDHDEILKECNAALKSSKNAPELLHTRIVALLKLERYEDVLKALEEGSKQLQEITKVEKAYALYRTGQLEEAKDLARSIGDSRAARHVEAQAVRESMGTSNACADLFL